MAAGLSLHGARDADAAVAWLIQELSALRLSPFDQPIVLVSHSVLRRALTLGIARATGCAASVRMLSPTAWVDEIALLAGAAGEWRSDAMAWRLTAVMGQMIAELPESVRRMVEGGDNVALLELSRATAASFRAYLLHRPQLLMRWEDRSAQDTDISENERWQRALWRSLVDASPSRSPAQIVADVRAGRFNCPDGVDQVILAVADPTVPPTVREVLCEMTRHRTLRWCVVSPPGERAIVSDRRRAATRALVDIALAPLAQRDDYAPTLLGRVQRILTGDESPSNEPSALDGTLTFHACHSPLREIETLREQLVADMEAIPDLRPHDFTLYVTSLERYLPAIDAVFGVDEPGMPRVPYNVAGRPFRDSSPVIFALLRLLETSERRETLEEIAALLRLTPIANAAGLTDDETREALSLAQQAGVVWGADGADRRTRYDLPELEEGTWRRGIDKLVLGVAMGPSHSPVGDVLPISGDTAGNADLIGRMADWTGRLFALFTELRIHRRAAEWSGVLDRAVRDFIRASGAEDYDAIQTLRSGIRSVLDEIAQASPEMVIGIPMLRTMLEHRFEEMAGELGDLRGGVRVCRLEPGAVLPARAVLIAGVDDALYPGGGGTPAWELLSQSPHAEDPDRRADALDVFRQAITGAECRAHVAWMGFSTSNHAKCAPSVAVAELSDIAMKVLCEDAREALVRTEPAHPFSQRLFSNDATTHRSAARGWENAARLVATRRCEHRKFVDMPLDRPTDDPRRISLGALMECIKDPTLYFCRRILNLEMRDGDEELPEREPQGVDAPGNKVANALRPISWRLEAAQRRGDARSMDQIVEWMRHQPEMPYGEEGRLLARQAARVWWPRLEESRGRQWKERHQVDLAIGEWTIFGNLDRLTPEARVVESLYAIKPHSAVQHWVCHLVMNVLAASAPELPRETHFSDGEGWKLRRVDDADAQLANLCAFYEEAQIEPQPLFRRSAFTWLEARGKQKKDESKQALEARALREARADWYPPASIGDRPPYPRESESPSARLCWANRGFDDDTDFVNRFIECTERMLMPFMQHIVREK